MGRQFRLYLLPADADRLLNELRRQHGLRILAPTSASDEPVECASATSNYSRMAWAGMFNFGQSFLSSGSGNGIPMRYSERQANWHIDFERSEVIELSTCDYGDGMLREGRFYYQKDMLSSSNGEILPKSDDFIAWAEQIFRTAKKLLRYSPKLAAYVGQEADIWRRQGGKLITGFRPDKTPIYADAHD